MLFFGELAGCLNLTLLLADFVCFLFLDLLFLALVSFCSLFVCLCFAFVFGLIVCRRRRALPALMALEVAVVGR